MFHPLIKMIASRPDVLAEHLGGYAALVSAQVGDAVDSAQRRLVMAVAMTCFALVGGAMAGVALLLYAAVPPERMNLPWLLWVAPCVPLAAAAICGVLLRQRSLAWSMVPLREQFAADAALMREASQAS